MKQKSFKIIFLYCVLFIQTQLGFAAEKQTDLRVQKMEHYFNSLGNIKASFEQVTSSGGIQKGVLYISRPDKMRWEYNMPEKYLIIVNHSTIIHYRYGLDELTHIPLKASFLRLFCKDNFSIAEGVQITHIKEEKGVLSVGFIDEMKEESPEITMNFTQEPMNIESIFVKDVNGGSIKIFFHAIKKQPKVDPSLFEFKRPVQR